MSDQPAEREIGKERYVRLFRILAIGLIVVSGIHLFSVLTSGATTENVGDFIYHLIIASATFGAAQLVKAGRRTVIYLLGIIGIIGVAYSLAMSRGFNPVTILITIYFIWQMNTLSKNGELA